MSDEPADEASGRALKPRLGSQCSRQTRSRSSLLLMAQPLASDLSGDGLVNQIDEGANDSNVTSIKLNEKDKYAEPLSASWRSQPLSAVEAAKVMQILQACKDHDRQLLSSLAATSGGFVEDHIRRLACTYRLYSSK